MFSSHNPIIIKLMFQFFTNKKSPLILWSYDRSKQLPSSKSITISKKLLFIVFSASPFFVNFTRAFFFATLSFCSALVCLPLLFHFSYFQRRWFLTMMKTRMFCTRLSYSTNCKMKWLKPEQIMKDCNK